MLRDGGVDRSMSAGSFFSPPRLVRFPPFSHGLRRGLHSCAASRLGVDGFGLSQRNSFRGQIGRRVGPLSQQRWVTILLGPFSS
jgi:hypothetical protein